MTVFMTPDGRPVLLRHLLPTGTSRRASVVPRDHARGARGMDRPTPGPARAGRAPDASRSVSEVATGQSDDIPTMATLDEATMSMLSSFDQQWGGFGRAPKFPQSMSLGHLLRHHHRTGSAAALEAVVTSLDAMAAGGMYDHIGGGFSRYSVDERWLVPHFEKMLYDNALLARLYTHAALGHGSGTVRAGRDRDHRLRPTRPLASPTAAATRPRTPTACRRSGPITPTRARSTCGHPPRSRKPCPTPTRRTHADAVRTGTPSPSPATSRVPRSPTGSRARGELPRPPEIERPGPTLLTARAKRPRPGLDDKVLTEWNAYFVTAAAEAGRRSRAA